MAEVGSEIRVEQMTPGHRGEKRVPVLYLDLDGTVRYGFDELARFVNGPEDVTVFPEVPPLLASYKKAGWRIIGVSNQGGVALGLVSERAVHLAMRETHKQSGEVFDRILWCPHHPNADEQEMAVCWCRKPRPGLLIEGSMDLARETKAREMIAANRGVHPLERPTPEIYPPHLALMVGDRDEDRACAEAANVAFMDAAAWRAGEHVL